MGLATGALLSRAVSWSASTPGPPLGVSRKPTRRVARFLAYRRAGPGSNRLSAIDELACVRKLQAGVLTGRRQRFVTHEDFDAFAAGRRVFDDLGLEPDVFEQSQPGLAWEDTHDLTVNDGAQIVALFQSQD